MKTYVLPPLEYAAMVFNMQFATPAILDSLDGVTFMAHPDMPPGYGVWMTDNRMMVVQNGETERTARLLGGLMP